MMVKKKCPVCGAKNSKERMTCMKCGTPLTSEQAKTQLSHVLAKNEAPLKAVTEREPKKRIKDEYQDNEKVLYKTRSQVSLLNKNPQEASVLVTEGHLVIEVDEPIKIPFSHIEDVYTSSTMLQGGLHGTSFDDMKITFHDYQNDKHRLSLRMVPIEQRNLQQALYRQMVGKFINKADECPRHSAFGKFFFQVKEHFRDKTRDYICAGLQRAGIDAQMAMRGSFEEGICDISLHFGGYSLGIIRISEGAIRWINVRKVPGGGDSQPIYYTDYGIADPKLVPDSPQPEFRFVDFQWKGEDFGVGIIERLNNDVSLKQPFLESKDVKIAAIADYGCWIVSIKTGSTPSAEQWQCYQAIAKHLLAEGPK